MSDFFSSIIDTGSQALGWLNDNPAAADFLTGAAVATTQYISAEKDRKMIREAREERKKYGGASTSGGIDEGYQMSLTNGALAGGAPQPQKPGGSLV